MTAAAPPSRFRLPKWVPFAGRSAPVVAVVRLHGIIAAGSRMRGGLNLAALAPVLERAFTMKRAKAIALQINSPGGAAAQTSLIYQRVRTLAEKHKKPVFAFIEDAAASGGYWLACAADEIYVDESSIVGSIGVIYAGFGLDQAIAKLGIERRLYTAGPRKSVLDPFQPAKEEDVERIRSLQRDVHTSFKAVVKARRGERLKGKRKTVFSGDFWTGRRALALGLVDGIGEIGQVMKARFGEDVKLQVVGRQRSIFDLLRQSDTLLESGSRGDSLAGDIGERVVAALEARLWWSRYGL